MARKGYIIRKPCVKCGKMRTWNYEYKRDLRAANIPDPVYCSDCNPNLLHGDDLISYCKSLLGKRYFSLGWFRRFLLSNASIHTIVYFECDQLHTYTAEKETAAIGWVRVYQDNLDLDGKPDRATWNSPEKFRKMRPVTEADKEYIIDMCHKEIERAKLDYGYTRWKIPGFERLIQEVHNTDDFLIDD